MTNFSGAFDLSNLNQQKPSAQANQVADWIVKADEQVLRRYLALSESVAVLMLITDATAESNAVRQLVYTIVSQAQGRLAGIEVDLNTSPQLAQAIGINQAPAMAAILAGQPAPLFKGNINQEQLVQVLSQVLQLAAQNKITGSVTISNEPMPEAKKLTPEHQAAVDAVDRGDLVDALTKFEKLVVEYPSDAEIKAGLVQVQLLHRLQYGQEPGPLAEIFAHADKQLISGDPDGAFAILLDQFANDVDNRELIRSRLIDLFTVTGDSHESVLAARRKLASLMF